MFPRRLAWRGVSAVAIRATRSGAPRPSGLRMASSTVRPNGMPLPRAFPDLKDDEVAQSKRRCQEIPEQFASSVEFPPASFQLQRLLENPPLGERVVLHGYLEKRQDMGKRLSFARLSDITLSTNIQIIAIAKNKDVFQHLRNLEINSPVAVTGTVQKKQASATESSSVKNAPNPPDGIEIFLENIQCLNDFPKDVIMTPGTVFPPTERYLQIRNDKSIRDALRFRARVRNLFRDALEERQDPPFFETETPLLFKSTPEGAREFIVPTRRKGLAYALPQSPQQYKQILMASGIPRYYQFARCFRDEDLRADRQPEFTQLDMEMSFATGQDVMGVIEDTVKDVWARAMPQSLPPSKFPRKTYHEAMSKYGSDKPDTRLGMEITRIDYMLPVEYARTLSSQNDLIIEAFALKGKDQNPETTRQFLDGYKRDGASVPFLKNATGRVGMLIFNSREPMNGLEPLGFEAAEVLERDLDLSDGDALIINPRPNTPFTGGSTALGDLRRELHNRAVADSFKQPPTGFNFLWVHGFPLFSPTTDADADADADPGQGSLVGLRSTHHPFTAPLSKADVQLLADDPLSAAADHYDLVLNGVELGGGSRRIHSAPMQEFIFANILAMPPERIAEFAHLLQALKAGCPPHAGFALGFDRLIATMLGLESVRDVIAFPKTGKGEDGMSRSPSRISEGALETYHLQLRK